MQVWGFFLVRLAGFRPCLHGSKIRLLGRFGLQSAGNTAELPPLAQLDLRIVEIPLLRLREHRQRGNAR